MKRITALLLAVLLLSLPVISCAERAGYQKEEKPQLFTGSHVELWNDIFYQK